jgi:tetratricopeptide (TPR) repeat protein
MGIKEKLPLLRNSHKTVRLFGYVIYTFVAIIILGAILPSHDNDSSTTTTKTVSSASADEEIDCNAVKDELDRARTVYWQNGENYLTTRQSELIDHCGAGREKDYVMPAEQEAKTTKNDVAPVKPAEDTGTSSTEKNSDDNWRELEPNNADDWKLKGDLYDIEDSDFANALRCYNKALELDPNHRDAFVGIEVLYLGQGDYTNALEYNNKVLEIDPEDIEALIHRGMYLNKLGRPYDAIDVYDQIINIASKKGDCLSKFDSSVAWGEKANIYLDLGKYDLANNCYDTSDKIGADWRECFFGN